MTRSKRKKQNSPHRLVPRGPAALPAQVEPLPDWTLPLGPHIHSPSLGLQGPGGCQRCQTVEVKGERFLTCMGGEMDCFGLDSCAAFVAKRVGFISRSAAGKSGDIYDISCVVYLMYTRVGA